MLFVTAGAAVVSVLSVEPWLVELVFIQRPPLADERFSALSRAVVGGTLRLTHCQLDHREVSVLSVEPWLVEQM